MNEAEKQKALELAHEIIAGMTPDETNTVSFDAFVADITGQEPAAVILARALVECLEPAEPILIDRGRWKYHQCACCGDGVQRQMDKFCPNCGKPLRWVK